MSTMKKVYILILLLCSPLIGHSEACWAYGYLGFLRFGPCRTIQNTSKCTDGSCTTTATDEMTCSSGVTINTSSTNNNTNGKKKRSAGPDISSKNNTSPQITSFDGRNLPSGFTLNRAKKLCFSLLTPVAKDILRRSAIFWQEGYQINENALTALTQNAFEECENDGVSGLSWNEIQECEDSFCYMLTIPCPTKEDFELYDTNQNGILTLDEYNRQRRTTSGSITNTNN